VLISGVGSGAVVPRGPMVLCGYVLAAHPVCGGPGPEQLTTSVRRRLRRHRRLAVLLATSSTVCAPIPRDQLLLLRPLPHTVSTVLQLDQLVPHRGPSPQPSGDCVRSALLPDYVPSVGVGETYTLQSSASSHGGDHRVALSGSHFIDAKASNHASANSHGDDSGGVMSGSFFIDAKASIHASASSHGGDHDAALSGSHFIDAKASTHASASSHGGEVEIPFQSSASSHGGDHSVALSGSHFIDAKASTDLVVAALEVAALEEAAVAMEAAVEGASASSHGEDYVGALSGSPVVDAKASTLASACSHGGDDTALSGSHFIDAKASTDSAKLSLSPSDIAFLMRQRSCTLKRYTFSRPRCAVCERPVYRPDKFLSTMFCGTCFQDAVESGILEFRDVFEDEPEAFAEFLESLRSDCRDDLSDFVYDEVSIHSECSFSSAA